MRGHLAFQLGDVLGHVGEPFLDQDDTAGAVDVHQVDPCSQHVQLPPGGKGFRLFHAVYAAGGVTWTFFDCWCGGAGGFGLGALGTAATPRQAAAAVARVTHLFPDPYSYCANSSAWPAMAARNFAYCAGIVMCAS